MKIDKQSRCMLEGIERQHSELRVAFEMFLAGVKDANLPEKRYEHVKEIFNIIESLEFTSPYQVQKSGFSGEIVKGNLLIRAGYLICKLNTELEKALDEESIPSALEEMLREYIQFTEETIFFIDFDV